MSGRPSRLKRLILPLIDGTAIEISLSQAVPEGEHYFSCLYRASIIFSRKSDKKRTHINFIIKTFPESEISSFMKESGAMNREITMYKSVIPQLNAICGKTLAPTFYDCKENDVLVMEDLSFKGFVMEDRIKQMDSDHCKHAIEILARFHAASVILHKRNPTLITEVGKEVLYKENNDYMKSFIVKCFSILAKEIENWPEISQYAERLREASEQIWKITVEAVKPIKEELCVLNHGDFWTNNILFLLNDQGAIENAQLIDFQFCRWTNPAFDLQSFLNRSVRNRKDVPDLIECYLNRFNEFLHCHQMKITKEEMNNYLSRMNCYGLITVVCLLPTCVRSRDQQLDNGNDTRENYNKNFRTDNTFAKAYKDPTYRKILPEILEYYVKEGVL